MKFIIFWSMFLAGSTSSTSQWIQKKGDNCIEMFVRGDKEDSYRGKLDDIHCENLDGEIYAIPMCQVYQEKLPTIPDLDDWPASGRVDWSRVSLVCHVTSLPRVLENKYVTSLVCHR